jgi:hypothetical protein
VSRNRGRAGRNATYLKLEKPRFLFLEGWGRLHYAYCHFHGACWHLHRRPGDGRLRARLEGQLHGRPSARGDRGAGSHLLEVVCSPLLSSSSEDEFANTGGGERPYCSRCRYSSLYWSRRSCRLILLSFAVAARSRSCCCAVWPVA